MYSIFLVSSFSCFDSLVFLHDPNSYSVIKIHTHEFEDIWRDVKSVDSWSDKLKYIFYPPGWSHDNSSKTTKQVQREFKLAQEQEALKAKVSSAA